MTPDPAAFRLLVCVGLVFAALMAAGIAAWAVRWARLFGLTRRWRRECEVERRRRLRQSAESARPGGGDPVLGAGGLWSDDGSHHGDPAHRAGPTSGAGAPGTENTEKE